MPNIVTGNTFNLPNFADGLNHGPAILHGSITGLKGSGAD